MYSMDYKTFIESSLEEAGHIALQHFGNVHPTTKSEDNNQVLTEADLAIGKYLVERVREQYPQHNVIDEETGVIDNGSSYTWVIDPIDGTSNFATKTPTYGIIFGLLENSVPVVGGIAQPSLSQLFVAEKGHGAYCNDEKISVTTNTSLLSTLVAYGIDGKQENPQVTKKEAILIGELVLNIRNLRSNGSSYDVMNVALGAFGGSLAQTSKVWDNVGQQIICEEAGALYTDFFGNSLQYKNILNEHNRNFTWCIAPAQLHTQLQKIIHTVY